jgi:hypothetical protein
VRIGSAKSMYSSQWQVGVTAKRWELNSGKMWLDTGKPATSVKVAIRSQPVTPPIFMTSGIT